MIARLIFLLVFLSLSSEAHSWVKVIECGPVGSASIDRFTSMGTVFYQFVIRDPEVTEYLRSKEAVEYYRISEKGVVTLPIIKKFRSNEFVGDHDARQTDGLLYIIHYFEDSLRLKVYTTSLEGSFYKVSASQPIAEWFFENCERLQPSEDL